MQESRSGRPTRHPSANAALRAVGLLLSIMGAQNASAEGCVVSRGSGLTQSWLFAMEEPKADDASPWATSVGYRWFKSDRHFVGSEEQKERQREGSEVINRSHFVDLSISYQFTDRYTMALVVPWVSHDRSQVVRANDPQRTILQRFHTQSSGIGDMRLMGYAWLRDPKAHARTNVLLGLGVDVPTGDEDARDAFLVFDPTSRMIVKQRRTVDQSIQPGDGGWATVIDLQAQWAVSNRFTAFFNGSYAITPEEKNGVPTYRSNPYESTMSISDSYLARAGVDVALPASHPVLVSLAGRVEGVPVHDLVGGSHGFRRPGYSVAIEPGLDVSLGNALALSAYIPIAVYRKRQRSVPDMQLSDATGTYRHGDAAFADYAVAINLRKGF